MSFIQNFFTSRDNNANAETFVGQEGRLWFDPVTNQIYSSDGSTPGGIPLAGGGGGNGAPGGSNSQVQFNNNGAFGGTANLTINSATGQLSTVSLSASGNVTGNYLLGNGSQLTGLPATYSNANVATFLADFGSNVISTTGNVTGGNLLTGGVLEFAGGSRLRPTGANLDIVAGAGSYVNLITSDDSSYMGVDGAGGYVVAAGRAWRFNTDGTTTFPSNNINSGSNPITLWSTDSSSLLWRSPTGGAPSEPVQTIIEAGNGAATITVATGVLAVQSQKIWTFNSDGNTTFPDATVQTTAYPGNATTLSLSGNIVGGNLNVGSGTITGGNVNGATFNGNVAFGTGTIGGSGNITGGNVTGTTSVAVGGTGGDLTMTGGAITGVGNITSNGIMAINAPGGITTTAGSFDIVNATATTVNIGGSATAVNIGATTGTLTLNNPVVVGTQATQNVFHTTATAVNAFGAATTITMGATSGTLTLRNPTIVGSQATQNLFNTVANTVNFAGAATALNIGGAGNATFSANTQVRVSNTGGSALSVAGNITGGNIIGTHVGNLSGTTVSVTGNINSSNLTTTGAVYSNYNTNTANTASFNATGGNTKGGTGYLDFLVAQNTSGGATNPYKWLRVNSTGGLEVINSAYTSTLMILTDAGAMSVSGSYQVNGKQAVNGPAFRAYIDGSQTITSGSQQKVTFGSETFDTNSNFASSRFTPTVEGYYQLNATVRIEGNSGTGEVMITIWKNGSEYARGTNEGGTEQGANWYSMQVSDLAYANGSTDYFEIYVQQTSGGNRNTTAGTNISYFSGAMVRGA